MRRTRLAVAGMLAAALTLSVAGATSAAASSVPDESGVILDGYDGDGALAEAAADELADEDLSGRGAGDRGRDARDGDVWRGADQDRKDPRGERDRTPAKPRNDVIPDAPVNPADASLIYGLVPYHEFGPRLRQLQQSDRISVEIIGKSGLGRDLYMIVATSPMSDREWRRWQELSDLRTDDPAKAQSLFRKGAYDEWKSPLFVNANIHGNEWEGTDAVLRVAEELAFSDDPGVVRLLDTNIMAFVVSMNPDGRVAATRANAAGFDMNRDFITQSQPEVLAVRDQLIRYDPLTMLDLHGYVNRVLIEPTSGPHGENYEWDLYIRNALPNALAMEQRLTEDNLDDLLRYYPDFTRTNIPFRDYTDGWDDWPPIFTPMYAMFHGSIGHTIEIPLNPRGTTLTQEQRLDRTRINTNVAVSTTKANLDWATDNRKQLLGDQLELFRRGQAGESSRPIDDPLALATGLPVNLDTFEQDYPDAYVIPMDGSQRSTVAGARLVEFLLDNDVTVSKLERKATIAGGTYQEGTYVVDMRQAKRGLANVILSLGRDVTTNFPTMYDISAWSNAELWGATVVRLQDASLAKAKLDRVRSVRDTGSVPGQRRSALALGVVSLADVQAVNRLLSLGVPVVRIADGTAIIPAANRSQAMTVADEFGVVFRSATAAQVAAAASAPPLPAVDIAFAGPADEFASLQRMGFAVTPVTTADFTSGRYVFGDFEAIYVSSTALNPLTFDAATQAAFGEWLSGGGTVVGRGAGGVTFNTRATLLPVTATAGRGDANGIVAVQNDPASPVTNDALPVSFVSSPRWFSTVGDGVQVDQRLATGQFFLAGHWIGQEAAAGAPVVVSGTARGADVTLFGTEPLYRTHPEGLFPQVAEALWR